MKNNTIKTDQQLYIERCRRENIFIKAARIAVLIAFIALSG